MTNRREAKNLHTTNSVWEGPGIKAYRLDPNSLILNDSAGHTVTVPGFTLKNGTFVSHGSQISTEAIVQDDCCILNSIIGADVVLGPRTFIGRRSVITGGAVVGRDSYFGEHAKVNGGVFGLGVRIGDNFKGGPSIKIANNVWVSEGCSLNGEVYLGEGCKIGANTALEHGSIGAYVSVGEHVVGSDGFQVPDNTVIPDGFEIIGFREIKSNRVGFRLVPPP